MGSALGDGPATVAGVPRRTVLWQRLHTADGLALTALNAAARHRPQGPPRHTTASCAEEWLTHLPPAAGAHILIVSGNPHTARTFSDITRAARATGRDDLALHWPGPARPTSPGAWSCAWERSPACSTTPLTPPPLLKESLRLRLER
ncbi:hypothetical protein T261_0534 [Streptomyces lydicus]|nr:hypothetical protein T261_0534 [Streptomyces lydicus]